ncbi:HD-GYP domain-containing protein (c-di-GMP phosphodiesterase class II) [Polynucleobacter brandtiae]|uniref:HD-GYP domain-containing protein (C-di-GMP phosphodiesterase class II) n=2 Tax=Polynucleobacter brandtiae TaxID=1938816 RepID=A0A2M8VPR2_9BURK|nr:HD-GYP domain-containing protein (c-di-GMP phosphodiesterase class II) [Polynucleobacter brandtiae]
MPFTNSSDLPSGDLSLAMMERERISHEALTAALNLALHTSDEISIAAEKAAELAKLLAIKDAQDASKIVAQAVSEAANVSALSVDKAAKLVIVAVQKAATASSQSSRALADTMHLVAQTAKKLIEQDVSKAMEIITTSIERAAKNSEIAATISASEALDAVNRAVELTNESAKIAADLAEKAAEAAQQVIAHNTARAAEKVAAAVLDAASNAKQVAKNTLTQSAEQMEKVSSVLKSSELMRSIAEDEVARYIAKLETAVESTLRAVSLMVEQRDPYTAGHERRVGELAAAIGIEMGLGEHIVKGLRFAGYVHDIGKIGIPAEILSKPTKLTAPEYQLVQTHAQAGYEILRDIDFPWPISSVILQHHERLDGSGYPNKLKKEAILLEAKIIAVADVVEAMCSHRPYRQALGIEAALNEITSNSGKLFDPQVVQACVRLFRNKGYTLEVKK